MKKHDTHAEKDILYHCPMDGCSMKYTSKANLRQHIIKHFPTKGPSDNRCLQIEYMPLLSNESLNEDRPVTSSEEGAIRGNETQSVNIQQSWEPVVAEVQEGENVEVGVPLGDLGTAEVTDPVAFICKSKYM